MSIEGDTADEVRTLLNNPSVMDSIEKVLSKGSTSSNDFTLHDEDHSYRVAERMVEILPNETFQELSPYELMLCILSCYLHDIGMTPEAAKIKKHYYYITGKDKSVLNEDEVKELQKWLDIEDQNIDIRSDSVEHTDKAQEILTYYARYKHNDWSEEWIVKHLSRIELPGYIRWQADLINICKSHHYGYEFLMHERLDHKKVNGQNCHRRIIALCLRLADVLEIDPERTPSIILTHREIAQKSLIYWLKDQEITVSIDGGQISFYARPQRAFLYKAVIETVKQIEDEIALCNRITSDKPLSRVKNANPKQNYHWHIFLGELDIKPFEDSFYYINGSFRPNVNRVLALLGGIELYGDTKVAIRELLQNSFDAVKEKIAYKRITSGLLGNEWNKKLGDEYGVNISIQIENENIWLTCKDQGVGMTRELIENYFLVSGASQKYQTSELIRKCTTYNIEYDRIGQFGIGVLSYFMIADRIEIYTKRAQDTGYPEGDLLGWKFTLDGIQDFGELTRVNIEGSGTEIKMLLKKNAFIEDKPIPQQIKDYLQSLVTLSPCKLVITSTIPGNEFEVNYSEGWTRPVDSLISEFMESISLYMNNSHSYEKNELINKLFPQEKTHQDMSFLEDISVRIKPYHFEEDLPENLGSFRVLILGFQLDNGFTFFYAKTKELGDIFHIIPTNHKSFINQNSFSYYRENQLFSWKGFATQVTKAPDAITSIKFPQFYYEVNLKNRAIKLSVNRNSVELSSSDLEKVNSFINTKVSSYLLSILNENDQGVWQDFNDVFLNDYLPEETKYPLWTVDSSPYAKTLHVKRINLPVVIFGVYNFDNLYRLADQYLDVLYMYSEHPIGTIPNFLQSKLRLHVIYHIDGTSSIAILATDIERGNPQELSYAYPVDFPENWDNVIAVLENWPRQESFHFINRKYFNDDIVKRVAIANFELSLKNDGSENEILNKISLSKNESQELLLLLIIHYDQYWTNLFTVYSDTCEIIWRNVFGELNEVYIYKNSNTLTKLTMGETYNDYEAVDIKTCLPQLNNSDIIFEEIRQ